MRFSPILVSLAVSTFVQSQSLQVGVPVTGGIATYYNQYGQRGRCGNIFSDNALIAAVATTRFSNSLCGQHLRVTNTATGKFVTVTIQDSCASCSANSLDLSDGAFNALANLAEQASGKIPSKTRRKLKI
ncbi:hypothetical protein BD410DRAFT_839769 [Rickenella mellea]|uniref:RlpA-like protein double-psi beta-barrel domain-containing protein n=1 Tax=Rickenella mellea TaxID=50990 RepID=A0A4Y7Q5X7_9AGAM|nr:hypothetical protein BD410DRAFT_839769 [Rickenella mellea]